MVNAKETVSPFPQVPRSRLHDAHLSFLSCPLLGWLDSEHFFARSLDCQKPSSPSSGSSIAADCLGFPICPVSAPGQASFPCQDRCTRFAPLLMALPPSNPALRFQPLGPLRRQNDRNRGVYALLHRYIACKQSFTPTSGAMPANALNSGFPCSPAIWLANCTLSKCLKNGRGGICIRPLPGGPLSLF